VMLVTHTAIICMQHLSPTSTPGLVLSIFVIEKELLRYNVNVNRNNRLQINKNVRDHIRHEKQVAQDLARSTLDEKLKHWSEINKNFEEELEHDREIAFRRHYERRLLNVDKIK